MSTVFDDRLELPRRLRRGGRAVLGAVLYVFAFLVIGSITIDVYAHDRSPWTIIPAVVALALLVGAIRMARSGVVISRDEVVVRDTYRTRHIPWQQIREIAPPDQDRLFIAPMIMTVDGRRVRCAALAPTLAGLPDMAAYRTMTECLAQARGNGQRTVS